MIQANVDVKHAIFGWIIMELVWEMVHLPLKIHWDGGVFVVILELDKNLETDYTKRNSNKDKMWNDMKISIPENCVLWTNKGICFPKNLTHDP